MSARPRRSVLYMPGSNERALEKARTLAADCLILDLEDAVAPDAKVEARARVCEAVKAGGFGRREVIVRVNALATEWGAADIEAACAARPDAILVPKVSSADDVAAANRAVAARDPGGKIALWLMMETALSMLNAGAIAAMRAVQGSRLACFVMGTNDLAKELHLRTPSAGADAALAPALALSLFAARAQGLAIIDGVYNNIQDTEGFAASCVRAVQMGFDGKTLIHPSQIEPCNLAFAPTGEEVAFARKLVAVFDQPENRLKGALQVDGRMVERLHAEEARRIVAIADMIEKFKGEA